MDEPRVGLLIPQYDCTIEQALDAARAADELGLDIWIAGQLLALSGDPAKPAFEPLTLMGALAAATARSRLGFMVLAAPYLPPFYLAKALITLDHLSGGRLEAGLGSGWREIEFTALGRDMPAGPARRAELMRLIEVTRRLSAGDPTQPGPAAVQRPHPPLWLAGRGPRMLDLVARHGDWANLARGISVEELRDAAEHLRTAVRDAGRESDPPRLSLTGTFLGSSDPDRLERLLERRAAARGRSRAEYREELRASGAFVGTPAELGQQLSPYIGAGCEALILWPLERHDPEAPSVLAALQAALCAA